MYAVSLSQPPLQDILLDTKCVLNPSATPFSNVMKYTIMLGTESVNMLHIMTVENIYIYFFYVQQQSLETLVNTQTAINPWDSVC